MLRRPSSFQLLAVPAARVFALISQGYASTYFAPGFNFIKMLRANSFWQENLFSKYSASPSGDACTRICLLISTVVQSLSLENRHAPLTRLLMGGAAQPKFSARGSDQRSGYRREFFLVAAVGHNWQANRSSKVDWDQNRRRALLHLTIINKAVNIWGKRILQIFAVASLPS